jgi:hypothetical protein
MCYEVEVIACTWQLMDNVKIAVTSPRLFNFLMLMGITATRNK